MNQELIMRVEKIRDKNILDEKELMGKLGYDQTIDLRVTSLKKLSRILVAINTAFELVVNRPDVEKRVLKSELVPELNNIDPNILLTNYDKFLRTSFVSALHVVYESTIRVYGILLDWNWFWDSNKKSWKKPNASNIHGHLVKKILEMHQEPIIYSDPFEMISKLRNSLHNNGIPGYLVYTGKKPKEVTYRREEYFFEPSKQINFVSWDLVLDLTEDLSAILFQMSKHEKLSSIRGVVIDPAIDKPPLSAKGLAKPVIKN